MNAPFKIWVIESGIVKYWKLQLSKTLFEILVTLVGIVNGVIAVHCLKAAVPIPLIDCGSVTDCNVVEYSKVQSPIDVTPSLTTRFIIEFLYDSHGVCEYGENNSLYNWFIIKYIGCPVI